MVKKEKTRYICLSQKDKDDLKKWFSGDPKSKKKKMSKKSAAKRSLDEMADKLKGKPYHTFLRSKYWSIVRKRVLIRDGNKCIICKSENNLEVHHDNYKHHFREHRHLKDLMVLCRECHKEHHYAQM